MRGFQVPRRAGWDTHGLPVEIEVEKELGIKVVYVVSNKDIEGWSGETGFITKETFFNISTSVFG